MSGGSYPIVTNTIRVHNTSEEYAQHLITRYNTELIPGIKCPLLPPDTVTMLYDKKVLQAAAQLVQSEVGFSSSSDDDHLRPLLFPKFLWQFVNDIEKPNILPRWNSFPADRLTQLITYIENVNISVESPERMIENHIMRAQLYSHIDAYGHPDINNPPTVKGKELVIALADKRPVNSKHRRYSLLERACIMARMKTMISQKRMQKSTSNWSSSILLVPQTEKIHAFLLEHGVNAQNIMYDDKYRDTVAALYRLTIDFRELNNRAYLEKFPLPLIADLLDKANGSNRYTSQDLPDAFHSIKLSESSRKYCAVQTPDDLVEYCVMPQGLATSPNTWARIISEIFEPLRQRDLIVYQDDIINHQQGFFQHLELQRQIYKKLREYDMILKWEKSHLNFLTMKILGHVLSKEGRRPDPNLIKTITQLAPPTSHTGLLSLIGLVKTAREYIPNLAAIIEPIQSLSRKGMDVVKDWKEPQQQALKHIKELLTNKPVLLDIDNTKKFCIHVDACRVGKGIGAILLQQNDAGQWQPVAYFSRTLSIAERSASATLLECIALHDSILHWHVYLNNSLTFDVITDHYALVHMVTKVGSTANGNIRLQKLCLELQAYRFNVIHRSGKDHADADAVSRLLTYTDKIWDNTVDDVRDDIGPLSPEEMSAYRSKFNEPDSSFVIDNINNYRIQRNKEQQEIQDKNEQRAILESLSSTKQLLEVPPSEACIVVNAVTITHPVARSANSKMSLRRWNNLLTNTSSQLYTNEADTSYTPKHFDTMKKSSCLTANSWIKQQSTNSLHIMQHRNNIPSLFYWQINRELVRRHPFIDLQPQQIGWKAGTVAGDGSCLFRSISVLIFGDQTQHMHIRHRVVDHLQTHQLRFTDSIFYDPALNINSFNDYISHMRSQSAWGGDVEIRLLEELTDRYIHVYERNNNGQIIGPINLLNSDKQEQQTRNRLEYVAPLSLLRHQHHYSPLFSFSNPTNFDRLQSHYIRDSRINHLAAPTPPITSNALYAPAIINNLSIQQQHNLYQHYSQHNSSTHHILATIATIRTRALAAHSSAVKRGKIHEINENLRTTRRKHIRRERKKSPRSIREEHDDIIKKAAIRRENADHDLEDYDKLVAQHYIDPDSRGLYEIVSVSYDSRRKKFYSHGRNINDIDNEILTDLQEREILGDNGTLALYDKFMLSQEGPLDTVKWPTTPQEWLSAQLLDPALKKILDDFPVKGIIQGDTYTISRALLEDNTYGPIIRKQHKQRIITHGSTTTTTNSIITMTILPVQLVKKCLYLHHDCVGHPGRNRTSATITHHFNWPNITNDVLQYVKYCRYCNIRKSSHLNTRIPLQSYDTSMIPFDQCHIDLTGPFTTTLDGNKYILVFKDHLTHWVEIFALPNKSAECVLQCLVDEIFMRHGAPRTLISDRGTEFTNILMKELIELLNIRHIICTPANPQSNGLAEQHMKTLKDSLVCFTTAYQNTWDDHLPIAAYGYRTTIDPSRGFSPFYMLYGREANTTAEDFEPREIPGGLTEYVEIKAEALRKIWEEQGKQSSRNTDKFNHVPAARQDFRQYQVGDYFFHKKVPKRFYRSTADEEWSKIGSKLQFRYVGPFLVTKVISPVVYEALMHNRYQRVHAINMKLR